VIIEEIVQDVYVNCYNTCHWLRIEGVGNLAAAGPLSRLLPCQRPCDRNAWRNTQRRHQSRICSPELAEHRLV